MAIPNPHVFRAYDVRGDAEADLPDEFVRDLGRALGTFWARRGAARVAVGRDCRLSSPRIRDALVAGLEETGRDLLDLGMVPTPLLYFAVRHGALDGGVQITGSHNPAGDNGFKIMDGARSLVTEDVRELRRLVESGDFVRASGGRTRAHDPLPAYVGFLRGNVDLAGARPRVALDAGNGAAGPAALAALRAVGVEPEAALLCEPDGRFPVHHPDPTEPANLTLLRDTVTGGDADLGFAYDGDGDRLAVVDRDGTVLEGDRVLLLLARHVLRERPGAAVLGEVKCSQVLYDDLAARGGRPILWKTGHALIKAKMKEEGALLAGEMSGHLFFADRFFGFDDAIYATLRVLEALGGRSPAALLADVPETHRTPEIRVECPDDAKFEVVERVKARFAADREVVTVDGARILFDGGWGLVRASNTQPALVLRFEAESAERLAAIRGEVETALSDARNP